MKTGVLVNRSCLSILFTAVSMIALTACQSQDADHTPVVSIDPQFETAVTAFQAAALAENVNIAITDLIVQSVPTLSGLTMGQCTQDGTDTPVVQVSQAYWSQLDTDGQQELLFHELGHCVLNRVHTSVLNNDLPISIMHPEFLGSAIYDANKAQYLHELFYQSNIANAFPMVIPQNQPIPVFSSAEVNPAVTISTRYATTSDSHGVIVD